MLTSVASSAKCIYTYKDPETEESTRYINLPIAYYGGGLNLSKVTYENYKYASSLSNDLAIDLISNYLDMPAGEGLVGTSVGFTIAEISSISLGFSMIILTIFAISGISLISSTLPV